MPLKIELLPDVACDVTRDVLETMFFSTAEPVPCRHPSPAAGWTAARVCFRGSPRGELAVMLSHGLSVTLASGFLGIDPDQVTADEENQVACELANMICGALLSRLHPDSRVALDAPEIVPAAFDDAGSHQCFETPDGPLAITVAAHS